MRTHSAPYPVWFVPGLVPVACPLSAGLICEIPTTRITVIADGSSCHSSGRCTGHNHPDPAIAAQAKDEFAWRTSH